MKLGFVKDCALPHSLSRSEILLYSSRSKGELLFGVTFCKLEKQSD
jgi:hypothetical protein